MRRTTAVLAVSVVMAIFVLSCQGGNPQTEVTPVVKDSIVRHYIQYELVPYLDSVVKEVCEEHDREEQPATLLCPEGDTYQKPPTNGKP